MELIILFIYIQAGTPRKSAKTIKVITGGQYIHSGLEVGLRSVFASIQESKSIAININIDGLPLYKNGTEQFWPILCNVHTMPHISPIIIGIFNGHHKPARVEEFLNPFVDEFNLISQSGILINGHKISVTIRAIICDLPARAFIKGKIGVIIQ